MGEVVAIMEVNQPGLYRDPFETAPCGPLGIIAMPGCEMLGAKVNDYLMRWRDLKENNDAELYTSPGYKRESFLLDVSCPRFGTGEGKGLLRGSVRGYDIYIISDVTAYQIEYTMYGRQVPMSPDDHYQDLKRIIGAIRGKAQRINVIMPFLYESRQHRRTGRESMDCAMALKELEAMGVTNIITFDAHDPRVQNAIPLTGFESVQPYYQVLKALLRNFPDLHLDKKHMTIISPDEGAINRNIFYSSVLGLDLGIFYKRRDYSRVINGRNPIVAHEYLGDDISGKDVLVSDDIISTGESVLDLSRELKRRNANRIFVAGTFCFFTNGLDAFQKAYEEGAFCRVLGCNLNYLPQGLRDKEWFIEVDMSKYISYIIATLNHDHSLHALLNPVDRISRLLDNYHKSQVERGIVTE